jgi:amino acid adenylation domain-containing protein
MMSQVENEGSDVYRVVVNDAQQYSIWPLDVTLPFGWQAEGKVGKKQACLAHISTAWIDMRAATLQSESSLADFAYRSLLHELIEKEAARSPESVAIVFEDQQTSYRELMHCSKKISHYLKHLGLKPEAPVCIFMDQSPELVFAVLGILQAGGVCVPLDPAYPEDHVDFILKDSGAQIVLTQGKFIGRLSQKRIKALIPREAYDFISTEAGQPSNEQISSENLAFIFYTSGSTGKAKGVMLSHRAIHSHNVWRKSVYDLTQSDAHLFRCPVGFAFLLTELILPLFTGARMIIALPERRDDPSYLVELIDRNKITIVNFVPSQIRMILEEPALDTCKSIRHWVTGGEALPTELQRKFYARFNATLSIIYGSTEARSSTLWFCPKEQQLDDSIVPIGRAAPGKQVFVVDSHLQPVDSGEFGELYIGGEGIARGYLNRPELTAEKFIPNPFSNVPGDRLYKTGDLARYHKDQTLEFLGRSDHQVKIRGFRIELGQIEAALAEHPDVKEAVVLCNEDGSGKKLVAYLVVAGETSANGFHKWLKEKVPAYMVPTLIQILPAIPRTSHGKIDFQALSFLSTKQNVFVNPGNATEQSLMVIWQQVFASNQIGVEDNFFELGGDSLLAAQIISRIREELDVNLPFKTLFEHATVAQLSRILRDRFLPL